MVSAPSYSARELAERFSLQLRGDGDVRVIGVATLSQAQQQQLAFLANPRYRSQLDSARAGIVVMRAADAEAYAGTALLAEDPYVALARVAALFEPTAAFEQGVHASSVIDATARIDPSA